MYIENGYLEWNWYLELFENMLPHVDAESSFSLLKGPFGDILHIQTGPYNMVNTIPRILMWKIDMYIYI